MAKYKNNFVTHKIYLSKRKEEKIFLKYTLNIFEI